MLIDYRAVRRQVPMQRVLDLIGYRATFRRSHQLRGPCPLHFAEPSHPRCFSVDLRSGLFRCFSCGAHGNQLDLWAQLHNVRLHTAAADLCAHAAVRVPLINPNSAGR